MFNVETLERAELCESLLTWVGGRRAPEGGPQTSARPPSRGTPPPTPRPAGAAVTSGERSPRCWAEARGGRGDWGWGDSRDPGPKLPPLLSRWQDGAAPGGAGRGEAGRGASTEAHSGHPGGRERRSGWK